MDDKGRREGEGSDRAPKYYGLERPMGKTGGCDRVSS